MLCLDENRRCKKNFSKRLVERTYINDRGYVHYRRHLPEDQWVMPRNCYLLLLLESHFNVEVSYTVNLIMYLYKYIFDRARYIHMHLHSYAIIYITHMYTLILYKNNFLNHLNNLSLCKQHILHYLLHTSMHISTVIVYIFVICPYTSQQVHLG